MGAAKDLMLTREHLEALAKEVLHAAGTHKWCPYHGEFFEHLSSLGQAPPYALANYKIGKSEIILPKGTSRIEFSDALKATFEKFRRVDGCRACEKYWAED